VIRGLWAAIGLLTTIPVPARLLGEEPIPPRAMLWWFVPVGALIGGLAAGVTTLAWHVLPWSAAAAMGVIALVALSGGLHLDGFMDTCDGLGSRATRERALEIMKDPNTGAFAVLGCVCLLVLKVALVAGMDPYSGVVVIALAPIVGRWMQVCVMATHKYARPEGGMGAAFFDEATRDHWTIALGPVLLAMAFYAPAAGVAMGIGGLLATLAAYVISRRLGGHTGDTVGAVSELTELLFVLVFACVVHRVVGWAG